MALVISSVSAISSSELMEFIVDKVVISQQSLQKFINALSPGAYSSITKVNFKVLDNFLLKPIGVYGSKEEIVRFLCEIRAVDDQTYEKLTFTSLVLLISLRIGRGSCSCRRADTPPRKLDLF